MKPLIGVPTDPFSRGYANVALENMARESLVYYWLLARLTEKICSSIRAAGGLPVVLSATNDEEEMETILSKIDGFVFAGGNDISPSFYGETDKGSISPNLERDRFEFALLGKAVKNEKPILGICRGCQMINVALGGTLCQHIPDIRPEWILHRRPDVTEGYVHTVEMLKHELFPMQNGGIMKVNSMHHQAVDKPADGLEIIAATTDGLTEGVSMSGYRYLVGVQWHPECLAASDPVQADLFSSLVKASR